MEDLPQEFWQGVQEFQDGQFYACHDTLEALWIEAQEPNKTFLQGILQIAVACYHLGNQNWRGAVILLGEGVRRLSTYDANYGGIDVTWLLDTSADLLERLQRAGPEQVDQYSAIIQALPQTAAFRDQLVIPQLRRLTSSSPIGFDEPC